MVSKILLKWLIKRNSSKRESFKLLAFDDAKTVMMLINNAETIEVEKLLARLKQNLSGKVNHLVLLHKHNNPETVNVMKSDFNVINLLPKDFYWFGWPRNSFYKKIANTASELILGFDLNYDLRLLYAASSSLNGFRIGWGMKEPFPFHDILIGGADQSDLVEIFDQHYNYLKSLNGEGHV